VFPQPNGGESYVSQEICLDPILADAPVITNVTVDKTDVSTGAITVKWRSPFDVDKTQYPPPYTYEVYRSEGISGIIKIMKPHPGRLVDSTFVDRDINTEQLMYNYRIVAYDAGNNKIDTSYAASSVRVEAKSLIGKIELTWNADVPWSNESQKYPLHNVYRGPEGSTEAQLELIGTADVTVKGFKYVDEGPLDNTKRYCYRIMTQGTYGNPKILEPLLNFSQKVCARPDDAEPPCVPTLAVNMVAQACDDPNKSGCGVNVFTNTLRWNRPEDPDCAADVASYSIYISDRLGDEFKPYVENVRDTFFVDRNENLKSFARCYKILAVDFSGNKSELSEQFCFDNCPQFLLPNVFTPNGDGCNDTFTAFGDPDQSGTCDPNDDPTKCARFVRNVEFVVYDKWGKEIYKLTNTKERSIYIRWNGVGNDGREVPAGVYYYKADVQFVTIDPEQEFQEIKGWVHLIRGEKE
jgi:CHU_C Type IX secretion signal domain